MTQAAASYQIKVLEERVGAALFLRKPRQVGLTETGARRRGSEAFDSWAGLCRGEGRRAGTLTVCTVLTFASNWLAWHLGSFQLAHPGIAVRVDTDSRMVDFARDEVDVGIRSGSGNWPGVPFRTLFAPISPRC